MQWVLLSTSSRDYGLTEDDIDKAAAESDVFRNNKRPPTTPLGRLRGMGCFTDQTRHFTSSESGAAGRWAPTKRATVAGKGAKDIREVVSKG